MPFPVLPRRSTIARVRVLSSISPPPQKTQKCWCAAEVDLRHGEGRCSYACAGDAGTTCGGFDAFDLFELEGVDPPPPPTEDYYVGCFADDRTDRVLEDKRSSSGMTLEVTSSRRTRCDIYLCRRYTTVGSQLQFAGGGLFISIWPAVSVIQLLRRVDKPC